MVPNSKLGWLIGVPLCVVLLFWLREPIGLLAVLILPVARLALYVGVLFVVKATRKAWRGGLRVNTIENLIILALLLPWLWVDQPSVWIGVAFFSVRAVEIFVQCMIIYLFNVETSTDDESS